MTIFWHKDASGKAIDTIPLAQASDLSYLHKRPDSHSADKLAAAVLRQPAVTQILFHLQCELDSASNTREAIHALLRAIDLLFEPALACVILTSDAEEDEEAILFVRFEGRSTKRKLPDGSVSAAALSDHKQAEWRARLRALWTSPRDAAEYLYREGVYLPLEADNFPVGAVLLWPGTDQAWSTTDLQPIHLALSITSLAIHRLVLQRTIHGLQQQLRECQAQALQATQRASRSERLACIGQVVGDVAHELNNPLTSIIGHAQLLQDAQTQGPTSPSLKIVTEQAQQCRQIVQSLLGTIRSSSVPPGPIVLAEVIEGTIRLMAHSLKIDGIDIASAIEPHTLGALANPHHLQQVLVNLIRNAQEALVHAGRGSTVYIGACVVERDGRPVAQIAVEDDGPGIPEDIRHRIFEPYFTTKQDQGTGLGLSISRQLILDMGGDLSLDAARAQGTRFVICLPLAIPQDPHIDALAQPYRGEVATGKQRRGKTLIIEDDENLADLVRRALEDTCHSVTHAANGEEALQQIARHDFDLILLDLRMPKSGGERTYECLRSRYPHLLSRLVFTTGDMASVETQRWLERTGCPVLAKPFDLGQLRHLASQFLHPKK